jgi:hypothetical protein
MVLLGFRCRRGFAGEVGELSEDGRIDGNALNGPPTSWVPPHISSSPTPPSID